MRFIVCSIAVVLYCFVSIASAESLPTEDFEPILPPKIYAVAGVPITIFYDNLVLTSRSESLEFNVMCKIGHDTKRGWTIGGGKISPGEYPISISTIDSTGKKETANSTIVVNKPSIKKSKLDLLVVGDSLTNATVYSNRIGQLLDTNKNLNWTMFGTRNPRTKIPGVNHEGYSGRTWAWFVNHYEIKPNPAKKKWSSPFVFKNGEEEPKLDFSKYLDKHAKAKNPDMITVLLGINDCFSAGRNPDETAVPKINGMLASADQLIKEFKTVSPKTKIGICITPPSNSRSSAFVANYKTSYTRDGWRIVLRELQKRQIEHFKNREDENLFLIPTQLNLDDTDGFPVANAVHPNAVGYNQIGDAVYSWIVAVTN